MIIFLIIKKQLNLYIASLAEARAKLPRVAINSDLSTEEEVTKRKKKKLNSDSLRSTNNAPPLFKDFCSIS